MTTPAQVDDRRGPRRGRAREGRPDPDRRRRKDGPGDWYEPTVIADADHSMKVMTDETFGPVVPVMKVGDAEEAVRMANDSRYGLSASVFAGDAKRGEQIARRIEAGAANVNDVLDHLLRAGRADGRLEGVRDRLPPRLLRDQEVRAPRVDRLAAGQAGQGRPALVPVHPPQAARHRPRLPDDQRAGPSEPARASGAGRATRSREPAPRGAAWPPPPCCEARPRSRARRASSARSPG